MPRRSVKEKGKKPKPNSKLENTLREKGYGYIAGIDEVGMSALAGNVVSSAVILDLSAKPIKGLNDSKLLSPEQRTDLYDIIIDRCIAYSVGSSTVEVINQKNIYWASRDAMLEAIVLLNPQPDYLLIDGKLPLKGTEIPQKAIVKGDQRVCCIAAASVIAKVTRDRMMEMFHEMYPDYAWASNKGYASPQHLYGLKTHGVTPLHRINFKGVIKKGGWRDVKMDEKGRIVKC